MYFSFLYVSSAADGSMISAVVLSGIAVTFLIVGWACRRAGGAASRGDVWLRVQSRAPR
jgi:hypothetical protein